MTKQEEVKQLLDNIEKDYLSDTVKYGFYVAIGYRDEHDRANVEIGSNLTKKGLLAIAKLMLDKAETM